MCSGPVSRESGKDVHTKQILRNFSSTFRPVSQKNVDKGTMLNHKLSSQSMHTPSYRVKSPILSKSTTNPPPIPPLPKMNHAKRPKSLKESKSIFTLAVRKSVESTSKSDVGSLNKVHGEMKKINDKKSSHFSMPIGRRPAEFSLSPEQKPPSNELDGKSEPPIPMNSSNLSSTKNQKTAKSSHSRGRSWNSRIPMLKNNSGGNFRKQTEMERFLDAFEGKLPSSENRSFQDETNNRARNTVELPQIIKLHEFEAYDEVSKINLATFPKPDLISSSNFQSNEIQSNSKFNEDFGTQKLEYAIFNEHPIDKIRSQCTEKDKDGVFSHLENVKENNPFLSNSNRNRISNLNYFSEPNSEQARRHTISTKKSSTLKKTNFPDHSPPGDIDKNFGQKASRILSMPSSEKAAQSSNAITAHIAVNPDYSFPNHHLSSVEKTSRNSSPGYTERPLATITKDSNKAFVASSQPQIHHPVAIRPQIKHLSLDYNDKKAEDVPLEKNANSLLKSKSMLWPSESIREEKQISNPGKDSFEAPPKIMDCTSSVSLANLITPYLESSNNIKSRLSDILNNSKLTRDVPSRNTLKTPDIQKNSYSGNPEMGCSKIIGPALPRRTVQSPPIIRAEVAVVPVDFDPDARHEKMACNNSRGTMNTESVQIAAIPKIRLEKNCESLEQLENYSASSPSNREWPHIPGAWEISSKAYNINSNAKCDSMNWPNNLLNRIADGISTYTAFANKRQEELTEEKVALESSGAGAAPLPPNGSLDEAESESESIYYDAIEVISNPADLLSNPSRHIENHNLELSNLDPMSTTCQLNTGVSNSEEPSAFRLDQSRLSDEIWVERDNLGIECRATSKQTQHKERKKSFPASPDNPELARIVGEDDTGRPGPFSGSRWDEYNFLHQRSLQKYRELLSPLSHDNSSTTDIHNDKLSENILTLEQKITPDTNLQINPRPQKSLDDSISSFKLDMLMEKVTNLKSLMCDSSELDSVGIKNFSHPSRFKLSLSVTSVSNQNLPTPGDSPYVRTTSLLSKSGELSSDSRSPNAKRESATIPSSRFSYSSDEKVSSCPILESRFSDSSDESYRPISRSSKHSDFKNGDLGEPVEFSDNECPSLTTTTNIKTINFKSNQLFDNLTYTELLRRKSDLVSLSGSQGCRVEQKDDFMSTIRRKKVNVSNKIRKHVSRPISKLGRRGESPYASRNINFSPNLGDSDLEKSDAWPFSMSSPMEFRDSEPDILKECGDSSDGISFQKYDGEMILDNNTLLFSVVKRKKRLETLRKFFAVDE